MKCDINDALKRLRRLPCMIHYCSVHSDGNVILAHVPGRPTHPLDFYMVEAARRISTVTFTTAMNVRLEWPHWQHPRNELEAKPVAMLSRGSNLSFLKDIAEKIEPNITVFVPPDSQQRTNLDGIYFVKFPDVGLGSVLQYYTKEFPNGIFGIECGPSSVFDPLQGIYFNRWGKDVSRALLVSIFHGKKTPKFASTGPNVDIEKIKRYHDMREFYSYGEGEWEFKLLSNSFD